MVQRAVIVAFDGLVADTQSIRAAALAEGVSAEITALSEANAVSLLHGRSLGEAVAAAALVATCDDTARELATLRAHRRFRALVTQGVPLCRGASEWILARAAQSDRVVLRADSDRRDVTHVLELAGLESFIAFFRCADDRPIQHDLSSQHNAWRAIAARLAMRQVALLDCRVFEQDAMSAAVARGYAPHVWRVDTLP